MAVDSRRGGVNVGGPVPLIKVESYPTVEKNVGSRYDLRFWFYENDKSVLKSG